MNDGEGRTTKGGFLSVLAVAVFAACGPSNGSGGGSDAPAVHTLKVTVTGDGTVLTNPAGINCGTVCSATFPEGTTVAFGAKGGEGSNFTGWSGACSGASACLIVMHADATVNATFVAGAPPPPNPPPENPPPPPVPADECADLTPASLPAPVVAAVASGGPGFTAPCTSGLGDDGDATFLLGYSKESGDSIRLYDFFQIQNGSAVRVGDELSGGGDFLAKINSQPSGFTVLQQGPAVGGSSLAHWSHDGVRVSIRGFDVPGDELGFSEIGV